MEQTVEMDPIYGPARPLSDVRNELVSTLANLPSYVAHVRIMAENRPVEQTIKTMVRLERIGDTADLLSVRDQSRRKYYRKIDESGDGEGPGGKAGDQPERQDPAETAPFHDDPATGSDQLPRGTRRRRWVVPPPESP